MRKIDFRAGGSFAGFVTNFAFYAVFSAIISTALAKIMFAASGIMLAGSALGRIDQVMCAPELKVPEQPKSPQSSRVEFEDVSFTYDGAETPALSHVSFTAEPGQTVALVGPSGGGKTTAASLIPRFWDATSGVVKVGGVVRDIDEGMLAEMKRVLEGIKDEYRQLCNAFLKDSSVKNRTVGVGYISHEDALAQSMVGPFARASNVNYDARMLGNGGYGFLSDFQPILDGQGDCYARVKVRALEVLQSIDIIEEMIAKIPAGDIAVDVKGSPAAGAEAANVVEQPRGECYYYVRGNGSKFLDRMRMRTPTSQNLAGMATALAGCDLADVNMIVLTIDPCISCTER